ncbi:MAG: hypothetical protein WA177_15855 [Xanthobacteraceae bacterium]
MEVQIGRLLPLEDAIDVAGGAENGRGVVVVRVRPACAIVLHVGAA